MEEELVQKLFSGILLNDGSHPERPDHLKCFQGVYQLLISLFLASQINPRSGIELRLDNIIPDMANTLMDEVLKSIQHFLDQVIHPLLLLLLRILLHKLIILDLLLLVNFCNLLWGPTVL